VDSDDPLQFTFDLLKEVIGDIGAVGGALFYHPYREADEGAVDVADVGEFWPEILFNDDHNSMEDVEDQLSFEPHFHAIVVAKYIPGGELVSKINHESGWVIKRITKGGDESDSPVSLYDEYDLTRASTYCLSHTGLYDTKNGTHAAYRYFGETANLQPRDHTEAKIDSAARSVAPKTLGLPFSDLSCSNSAPDNYADDARVSSVESVFSHSQGPVKTLSDDQSPDGSQTGSGAEDSDFIGPSSDDTDSTDSSADRCAGRLLPITKAPALLGDEDWRESAQHIDKLRDTWKKWRDRVDTPPPDPPPGPQ
jgi:hypothetical protein